MSNFKHYLRRLILFKGQFFYEAQVGPWVIQLRHTQPQYAEFGRVLMWRDPYWRL